MSNPETTRQVSVEKTRVANVSVTAWQRHRREPIATARAHYLMASEIRHHLPSGGGKGII